MWTEKELQYLESASREDYAERDRDWILAELLLRNTQMAKALREEKDFRRREVTRLRDAIGVAGHFYSVCMNARRRYPNPRKTINIDEALAEAESRFSEVCDAG